MQNDVVMAGFGGQGILLIGKMLAYAGMHEGKEVSWLPSYGPEMRGGTANVTVTVSEVDAKTETTLVTVEGDAIVYDDLAATIGSLGASVHSIDAVEVSSADQPGR